MVIDSVIAMVHAALLFAATSLLVLALVLLVEVLAGFRGARRVAKAPANAACSYVVVIPAHNEVGTIEETLAITRQQIGDTGRVLVVADNCTDATAAVSAAAGAEVIERSDPARRGKGYALHFAFCHLASDPPDVVVLLDADCTCAPGTIQELVANCRHLHRPIQARYELEPPQRSFGPVARVGAFAWRVKNIVRPTGLSNLGLACLLMGTGMAVPWAAVEKCHWETGHLVEDMVLGLELAAAGLAPVFLPDASVRSALPPSTEGQTSQRTRWETGHLQVITRLVPRFFGEALRRRDAHLFALTLHAAVPPLALLALLLILVATTSGMVVLAGGPSAALAVSLGAGAVSLFALAITWQSVGRDLLSPRDLLKLPIYIALKIPIYVRALAGSKVQWIRTKRDQAGP